MAQALRELIFGISKKETSAGETQKDILIGTFGHSSNFVLWIMFVIFNNEARKEFLSCKTQKDKKNMKASYVRVSFLFKKI